MVPGFRHRPGRHCGSTALRNLCAFHGLELSEAAAFGLAAGPCFYYFDPPGSSPSRMMNGRTARLEPQFVELTGAAVEQQAFDDEEQSWTAVRATLDGGAPVLCLTDLYHLEHYGRSAHFPGHAVVLAGYDAEAAYLADTGFEELQRSSLQALARARHSDAPPVTLHGEAFTVRDRRALAELGGRLPEAARGALALAARQMLEPAEGMEAYQGLPALRRLAAELPSWPDRAEDWQWCARFGYQVIERRGTGGGNFRTMYAEFLEEADGWGAAAGLDQAARRCRDVAARWTALAESLQELSEADRPEPVAWEAAGRSAEALAAAEEELWDGLAAAA